MTVARGRRLRRLLQRRARLELCRCPASTMPSCAAGRAGTYCESCATGYQDYDADGTCQETCEAAVSGGLSCTERPDDVGTDPTGTAHLWTAIPGRRAAGFIHL